MLNRRVVIPVAVFAAFAGVLGAAFAVVDRQADENRQRQPQSSVTEAALRLDQFINSRLMALQTLVPQMETGRLRSREGFGTAANAIYNRFPGFQAINWVNANGDLQWVNPIETNRAAEGRNVFAHAQAGLHARRAKNQRVPVTTPPLTLFQGAPGFVVYYPVLEDGEIVGYVNGVFRVDRVVASALGASVLEENELRIVDDGVSVYETSDLANALQDERPVATRTVFIGGRAWKLTLAPSQASWNERGDGYAALLVIGLVLAGGLALLVGIALSAQDHGRQLARSQRQLATLVDSSMDPILVIESTGRVCYSNGAARALAGVTGSGDYVATNFLAGVSAQRVGEMIQALQSDNHWEGELEIDTADGETRIPVYVRIFRIPDPGPAESATPVLYGVTALDLRHQKKLQLELQHATKMESVGRLAGGVAHDFNNLLTAMTSYATLLRSSEELPDTLTPDVDEIIATARRGASLTSQLLTFARKESTEPTEIAIGPLLRGMKRLLGRVMRSDVMLSIRVDPDVGTSFIDPTQFEQAVLNLCINSLDAMPRGGELTVTARRQRDPGGDWIHVRVEDTGVGMKPDVLEKVFDPFFTTKPVGKGTGLGLSSVYGLVTGAGGTVNVNSEPGVGTVVDILLPRVGATASTTDEFEAAVQTPLPAPPPPSAERRHVLLVEDERAVRRASRRILERGGFSVAAVADGVEAMNYLADNGPSVDIIVTDVVMPRMGGTELAERIRAAGVTVPVLLCSGYTEHALPSAELDRLKCERLEKPYPPADLLDRLDRMLSSSGPRTTGRRQIESVS